jgi:hypothetical protein
LCVSCAAAETIRHYTFPFAERLDGAHLDSDYGKWIAISLDGRVIIRNTAGEVTWAAIHDFGEGNFAKRKLSEFPGHELFA